MIPNNNTTPAFTLTVDQLKENVQNWVSECVEPAFKPIYLTTKELALALKISSRTLSDYTAQGIIPHLKFGKSVRYVEQDVYKALKNISER